MYLKDTDLVSSIFRILLKSIFIFKYLYLQDIFKKYLAQHWIIWPVPSLSLPVPDLGGPKASHQLMVSHRIAFYSLPMPLCDVLDTGEVSVANSSDWLYVPACDPPSKVPQAS